MFLLLIILVGAELSFASESAQDTSAYNNNVMKNVKKPNLGALGFYASLTNNQWMVLTLNTSTIKIGKFETSNMHLIEFKIEDENTKLSPSNKTYFAKDENQLRLPKNIYDDPKMKKKNKKSPKRTIQKIIKKGKNRSRKIYVNPVTRFPTISPKKYEIQDSDERYSSKNVDVTTEINQRRKSRKNTKFSRNPMPFHKFQTKKDNHNRFRRQIERDNVYILKDLDEVKFLSRENDYDIIQAHVQKYW